MSPTARSLKKLRKEGWTASVVEKWIPQVKRRRDCFGFDVLACKAAGRFDRQLSRNGRRAASSGFKQPAPRITLPGKPSCSRMPRRRIG
jgi:hypothetical protein